jgi:hypothetical protein
VKQDVDGDAKVEFGEGVPDAGIHVAALREFDEQAKSLDADAQEFEPTPATAAVGAARGGSPAVELSHSSPERAPAPGR